jgi:hypothetical protein
VETICGYTTSGAWSGVLLPLLRRLVAHDSLAVPRAHHRCLGQNVFDGEEWGHFQLLRTEGLAMDTTSSIPWYTEIADNRHGAKLPENPVSIVLSGQKGMLING